MKIIDAHWEKQNLGVNSACELVFAIDDDINAAENLIKNTSAQYLVAKVPSPRVDLLMLCQQNGYKYIETNISIKKRIDIDFDLPKTLKRFQDKIRYRLADTDDLDKIFALIKNGLFDDDKVALDSNLGPQKSANRYYNWISSDLQSGIATALIVSIDTKEIGFLIVKEIDKTTYNGAFGGLFPGITGFGFALTYASFCYAKSLGYRYIESGVSSNNPDALKSNLLAGYEINNISYCLIKHTK